MKHYRNLILGTALMVSSAVWAQEQHTYTGVVTDDAGEPIIGATVKVPGSSTGVITDLDGKFSISTDAGKKLEISYIGFKSQTLTVSDNMRITLVSDQQNLEEVVVVGYGVQKKPVVTASIAQIDADDLKGTAPVRMDNALKGLASGVTVTSSSGQPGAAAQIRIRGVGTINNSDPLYIVDGMPIEGGLDYLNPSDIQSISVLKDAASGAIYGTRAANGVILVTTKKGKKGRTSVNYNFSYGWQNPWKKRDVLNATEYAIMMNEGLVNAGQEPIYDDPYSYGEGTDWQEEVFNDNAGVSNHELNISGASDRVNYYLSMGYYHQDGIVGGNYNRSNYRRLTLRANSQYLLFDDTKTRDWLNKLTVTVNLSYARVKSKSIDANSQWGSVLGSALYLSPILTPTVTGAAADAQSSLYGSQYMLYDSNGEMYTVPGSSYQEMNNPLAMLSLPGDEGWSHKFVANFAGDLSIGWGLKYRISYSADMSFWGSDGYTPLYYLSGNNKSTITNAHQTSDRGTVWQLENTLTWDKVFGDHTINLVVGQSALKSNGRNLYGMIQNVTGLQYGKPNMNFASGLQEDGEQATSGGPANEHRLSSYFFRASYNYAERYMAQFTIRRDGSSRFGANHRYATFPSFSLGWNITNEPFMQNKIKWLSNLKLRASWGKNGNDNIGDFSYAAYSASGYNGVFGKSESTWTGTQAGQLPNPDLKWEESEQTDIGLDFGFFRNALTFSVDVYKKKTNGMIISMPIPNYVGATAPLGNVGDMTNEGVEMETSYKWRIADAQFHVKGNLSYLKNRLDNLGNSTGFLDLDNMQNTGTITRASNGEPFPYFYGYKTDGIFQTMEEVNSYVDADGNVIQPDAQPGDVRFVDINGDGTIDASDRTKIGKGMPDWTYGLTFTANWRNFDFMFMFQGTIGNDIYDATRRTDVKPANLPSYMLNRWTGPGTSNKYPRFVVGDGTNWQSSDLYITDGSYFRLKNIQLGYTIPQELTRKVFIKSLRVYVAAENLFTLTKYAGYDPEISSGGTSLGVDYGVYPQSRTFTVGFNLGF
ncbi:MAG: SusC/RagA family TonB-linked outer membrane protein [Prevotella sp.]|jgi:TonB-linked SusC/RagA family outer membrane protein